MSKKNERIEGERRVDGEFYAAELLEFGRWEIRRVDGRGVGASTYANDPANIRHLIDTLDQQAHHWIEHTQAQNQGIREAAERSVREIRDALNVAYPFSEASAFKMREGVREAISPLAALSNNPQVSGDPLFARCVDAAAHLAHMVLATDKASDDGSKWDDTTKAANELLTLLTYPTAAQVSEPTEAAERHLAALRKYVLILEDECGYAADERPSELTAAMLYAAALSEQSEGGGA